MANQGLRSAIVLEGTHSSIRLNNLPVTVVTPWRPSTRKDDGFIQATVSRELAEENRLPWPSSFRIRTKNALQIQYVDDLGDPEKSLEEIRKVETEEERAARIDNLFGAAELLVSSAIQGNFKGLVLSSPGGFGKTWMIRKAVQEAGLEVDVDYVDVRGNISPVGLYELLYNYRTAVVILQDIDSIFGEENALNILKAALDTTGSRTVSWHTQNKHLLKNDVPLSFNFEGTVLFATNLDIANNNRETKIGKHLEAFTTRLHLLNLHLYSIEDKLYKIRQVCSSENFLKEQDINLELVTEFIDWLTEHNAVIKSFSPRAIIMLRELYKTSPAGWRNLARATMFKNKYK